jgi:TonB-linked SusC/RagA family outer membrane protein
MYKFYTRKSLVQFLRISKLLLFMRLTTVILLTTFLQVSAASFAQKITLSEKSTSLTRVFTKISQQSDYDFLVTGTALKNTNPVTINAKNLDLNTVLMYIFKNQPVSYTIIDKTIVVEEKKPGILDKVVSYFTPPHRVTGLVRDENGKPLVGVNILNKRSKTGTVTNAYGAFSILADRNDMLSFSIVGYKTREILIDQQPFLNISMEQASLNLDQIIITGYTEKKASEITGAVQSIQGEDLRSGVSTNNTLAMLKGKAVGLYIVEQGGSVATRGQVVMRGQSSFNDASNNNYGPLIVLDGVITNAANLQDIVNANDIESVNILKDAASTAIYGSRAAQGVLVVNTKRGKQGDVKINLSLNYGKVDNNRAVRFMNTQEAAAHITKAMQTLYNNTASLRTIYGTFDNYFKTTRPFTDNDLNTNTQWDNDAFFSNGDQSNVNLSLSGGSEKTRFFTAANFSRQDGTLLDDNLDRKAIRVNIDQVITKKLSFSLNTNVLLDKYTSSTSENQYYFFQPWVSPNYANGSLADSVSNYVYRATGSRVTQYYDNPLFSHSYNTQVTSRKNFLGTGIIKYAVLPGLTIQSSNTVNYTDNNINSYRDPRTYRGRYDGAASNRIFINGSLSLNDTKTTYVLSSNIINYNKTVGDHHLSALAGQEYGKTHAENVAIEAYNTPYPGERNLGAFLNYGTYSNKLFGVPPTPYSASPIDKASFSLFSELNDNYKSRYFASASLRRDASTNFGINKRNGTFYSVSGGWLISNEQFMKKLSAVDNLKLRASYGTSGREAGADYLNFSTYSDAVFYNTTATSGSTITQLGNDNITWETTYATNLGLDIGLWKRIYLTVDVYNKDSKNLLQNVPLPSYVGFSSQYRNVGAIRNKGLDLSLNVENVKARNFSWNMSFNISFNKNKILSIKGDSLIDGFSRSYYRYVGEDINTLKAIKYVGVNPDNGRPLFERVMPNGSIQVVDSIAMVKQDGLRGFQTVGSATPKFFGGWTNNFRYKNFDLSIVMNYSYGNKIMNTAVRNFLDPTAWQNGFNIPQPDQSIRLWQGPGDTNANYPNFYDPAFSQRGSLNINSSLLYVDASYIRMRNIRLGYDIPKALLAKFKISSINVYASADNVFVIKSKELFASDPEGAVIGGTSNSYGGTGIASAMPRRFLIGLTAGF